MRDMYVEHLATGMLGVRKLMSSIALDRLQLTVVARAADTGKPAPTGSRGRTLRKSPEGVEGA